MAGDIEHIGRFLGREFRMDRDQRDGVTLGRLLQQAAEQRFLPLPSGRGSEKQVLIPPGLLNRARQQAATKRAFSAACQNAYEHPHSRSRDMHCFLRCGTNQKLQRLCSSHMGSQHPARFPGRNCLCFRGQCRCKHCLP